MNEECPRILCVDDEPNVLQGLERTLFEHFDVVTAESGVQGLLTMVREGPFAVVVSDMQMPHMNGAKFLEKVRSAAPDTSRILLTGHADLESAIAVVNRGNIFRFLCKPCPSDVLIEAIQAAAGQYRLLVSERELLNKTLNGAVKVLADVLSLTAPVAFSRAGLVKSYVAHMAQELAVADNWQIEMAAMLSQIGCITLPPDTMDRMHAGQPISESEQQMFDAHPETGARLLSSIPRLEGVAEIIRQQGQEPTGTPAVNGIELGGAMLKVALAIDRLVTQGKTVEDAVHVLRKATPAYDPALLDALDGFRGTARGEVIRAVKIAELRSFMILAEDVMFKNGNVVVKGGREITTALIERLKNFARGIGVVEPIRVRMPA